MRLVFTKHALRKFADLRKLGITVRKKHVAAIVGKPEYLDTQTDPPQVIASGDFDKAHILRVVYRNEGDIIVIITFYPARKGRYYS